MENIPDQKSIKKNNILSEMKYTEDEKKEKILLEFAYYNHKLESKIQDKKELKEFKSIYTDLENSLKEILEYDVPQKTVKNYIALKESDFDSEFLRLAKFLK